jgi:hypothetical protein
MFMRVQSAAFLEGFLTNAEINLLGTLESAETGQRCATVGYICREQLQEYEAARLAEGVEAATINHDIRVLRRIDGAGAVLAEPNGCILIHPPAYTLDDAPGSKQE